MEEAGIQFVPAERVSLAQRVAIMNAAYADYLVPTRVSQEQMGMMDEYFDISPTHSVVARTRWESIGMALLARRGDRAWVSGVGVVPAWRRRGVALAMMQWLGNEARLLGAKTVLLEVISGNTGARNLYTSLGYRECRELLTWLRPLGAEPLPIPTEHLTTVPAAQLLAHYDEWHSRPSSWQRDLTSLTKMAPRLKGYRLDWRGEPSAYCLIGGTDEAVSLVDVAVNPSADLLVPGRLLLQALAALHWGSSMSIMNVPADDNLNRVLAVLGFHVTLRQIEMELTL